MVQPAYNSRHLHSNSKQQKHAWHLQIITKLYAFRLLAAGHSSAVSQRWKHLHCTWVTQ